MNDLVLGEKMCSSSKNNDNYKDKLLVKNELKYRPKISILLSF